MGVVRRKARDAIFGPEPAGFGPTLPADPDPGEGPNPDPAEISVARTLVKSEPELAELVASEPALMQEGVEVSLAEKGFGTRVAISATDSSGLHEADLERLLDALAEPQKRPFTAA
jgi:hypothetical protein